MNIIGAIAAALAVMTAPATTAGTATTPDIWYVHGVVANGVGCVNGDNGSTLQAFLQQRGWAASVQRVEYYCGDSGDFSIDNAGCPSSYYAPTVLNDYTVDIRRYACDLAWAVYHHSGPIDIVAHSMGGLILRYALYATATRNPAFPPSMDVPQAVTIATPHDGFGDVNNAGLTAATYMSIACGTSVECQEMVPGSALLTELRQYGMNPQGANGTDWTVIGGMDVPDQDPDCDIMTATESTDAGAVHKIDYPDTTKGDSTCYTHTGYLTDSSTAQDAPVLTTTPAGVVASSNTGWHSLEWVYQAVSSNSY